MLLVPMYFLHQSLPLTGENEHGDPIKQGTSGLRSCVRCLICLSIVTWSVDPVHLPVSSSSRGSDTAHVTSASSRCQGTDWPPAPAPWTERRGLKHGLRRPSVDAPDPASIKTSLKNTSTIINTSMINTCLIVTLHQFTRRVIAYFI